MRPTAYTELKLDVGSEALTPAEIVKALSKVSGKDIRAAEIEKNESKEMAKGNHVINAQFFFNERSAKMDRALLGERFPRIEFVRFKEYLEGRREVVVASFV